MKRINENIKLLGGIVRFHGYYKLPLITNSLLFAFCILVFSSCSRYKEETSVINKMIQGKEFDFLADKQYVVLIVPAAGCSTCSEPAKEFINQINSPKFIIIGSCYSSRDFRMSFSEHELEGKNYIIDSGGQAFRHGLVDNGARLYFFKDCKILDVKIVACTEPNLLKQTIDFLEND
jgi:hypothetical protein